MKLVEGKHFSYEGNGIVFLKERCPFCKKILESTRGVKIHVFRIHPEKYEIIIEKETEFMCYGGFIKAKKKLNLFLFHKQFPNAIVQYKLMIEQYLELIIDIEKKGLVDKSYQERLIEHGFNLSLDFLEGQVEECFPKELQTKLKYSKEFPHYRLIDDARIKGINELTEYTIRKISKRFKNSEKLKDKIEKIKNISCKFEENP